MPIQETARKTAKRVDIVDRIAAAVAAPVPARRLGLPAKDERKIAVAITLQLEMALREIIQDYNPDLLEETVERKAREALLWQTTAPENEIHFMGTDHRPDFVVNIEGIRVAVDVQQGEDGPAVEFGLGKALVYAYHHDFVVFSLIDNSSSHQIQLSLFEPSEKAFVEQLWEDHNIRFRVV